jgi:hypothetical protein
MTVTLCGEKLASTQQRARTRSKNETQAASAKRVGSKYGQY